MLRDKFYPIGKSWQNNYGFIRIQRLPYLNCFFQVDYFSVSRTWLNPMKNTRSRIAQIC